MPPAASPNRGQSRVHRMGLRWGWMLKVTEAVGLHEVPSSVPGEMGHRNPGVWVSLMHPSDVPCCHPLLPLLPLSSAFLPILLSNNTHCALTVCQALRHGLPKSPVQRASLSPHRVDVSTGPETIHHSSVPGDSARHRHPALQELRV